MSFIILYIKLKDRKLKVYHEKDKKILPLSTDEKVWKVIQHLNVFCKKNLELKLGLEEHNIVCHLGLEERIVNLGQLKFMKISN